MDIKHLFINYCLQGLELAKKIDIAIEQEKKINEDIHKCKGQVTCNIGKIIEQIKNDRSI